MFILGINTASDKSNIILWKDGSIYELFYSTDSKTYGETLITYLKVLLDISGWKLENIDLYAVITGPGSFTGLRIGILPIKTLSQIYQKPIVGISYLECLAFQFPFSGLKISIMPARKEEVHAGFYNKDNQIVLSERILSYYEFINLINKLKERYGHIALIGNIPESLKKSISEDIIIAPEYLNYPKGESIIYLAIEKYKKGEILDYLSLLPDYRQKSSAEINWEKRNERSRPKNQ